MRQKPLSPFLVNYLMQVHSTYLKQWLEQAIDGVKKYFLALHRRSRNSSARGKEELVLFKETTLERADFTFQLLMFVTAEKERRMFTIIFLSIFC